MRIRPSSVKAVLVPLPLRWLPTLGGLAASNKEILTGSYGSHAPLQRDANPRFMHWRLSARPGEETALHLSSEQVVWYVLQIKKHRASTFR